ncbi:DUF7159 family protein [Candidatus Mycobacterium methanotrophicum]|uniref:DUF7159 domain-containing protein n=1 Tax=Candidatus Mycobacterium methanotrophicum TaxID=2943498 RepID=A0ABY4QIK8_9MYCO|nr:hypothetical protein [Candidatus Mycobacterium methanotrophicum]UQX09826.1 hypothetical protein M5I08_16300 [Candidatus Mycobacterium methanotrophicum]
MDTVVGLSLTSTSVGWVLVEGRDADGSILDHDDFQVAPGGGVRAVNTSAQTTAAVFDAQATAINYDHRLHEIAVTWCDEAAAEAALLLESLTDAGFDNVVPIRLQQACEMLARAIAPVVGYDKAAVCVLDGDSTIVVMVDTRDAEPQTATKALTGGAGRLVGWLTALFDRSSWQPGGIVIVGPDEDLEALAWRLEKAVPVPVITQTGAQLALARGAALASAESIGFTHTEMAETAGGEQEERRRSRQNATAPAMTMLIAGAVTFVASLSFALGPSLVPDRPTGPVRHAVHKAATHRVAQAPAPRPAAVEAPAARPAPAPVEAPAAAQPQIVASDEPSAELPAAAPIPPPPPPEPVAPVPPPPDLHPLLTKLLERLHGQQNPSPDQPAPAQGPPPNAGAPPP